MRSALCGVLPVDERIIFFAVLVGVRDGHFNVFAVQVDDGIQDFGGEVVVEQVFKPVFRNVFLAVEGNCQAGIQKNVVFEQRLDVLIAIDVIAKDFGVGSELNDSSVVLR